MCDNCNGCDKPTSALVECYLDEPRQAYETVKAPETWEELKELCKDIKGNKRDCGGAMWFEFPVLNNSKVWLGKALAVDQKGQVGIVEQTWGKDNFSITIFAQHRTPSQMWQIIKSLIGEE